jgi:hypothetical protein
MAMLNVKQVNKQGQISIGKKYAGKKVRQQHLLHTNRALSGPSIPSRVNTWG